MRILVLAVIFGLGYSITNAQTSTFSNGDKVLNLGIGVGGYANWGYAAVVPPVSASFEVGIKDGVLDKGSIGVGGFIAYSSYKDNSMSDNYWSYNRMILGARGTFHYPFIDKLDTYAGLLLGFGTYSWKWHGSGPKPSNLASSGPRLDGFVGGRYYFADKIAAMAELGSGLTYLTVGLALKLK